MSSARCSPSCTWLVRCSLFLTCSQRAPTRLCWASSSDGCLFCTVSSVFSLHYILYVWHYGNPYRTVERKESSHRAQQFRWPRVSLISHFQLQPSSQWIPRTPCLDKKELLMMIPKSFRVTLTKVTHL